MSVRFQAELLEESLDEAGDLFIRRCQCLNPPESGLFQVLEVDNRLDAHLDLLFYAGGAALPLVAAQATTSTGGLYAGLRTAFRQGQLEACARLTEQAQTLEPDPDRLAADEPPPRAALASAAAHEPWPGDFAEIERHLRAGGDSPLAECLAYAAGHQRWGVGTAVMDGLAAGVKAPAVWLWALGQIGEAPARGVLLPFLEDADPDVARAAALALCRTEDDQVAQWLAAQATNQLWAPVVLAFLGGPHAALLLAKHIETGDASAALAAGLLGDGALLPVLIGACAAPQLAPAAAQALHLMTGLAPMEAIESPPGDDGELTETDAPGWRLARSADRWREAIHSAGLRLPAAMRHRGGVPATPLESVIALRSPHLRQEARAFIIDELFVRYGLGVHLRADQHAARQLRVLEKLESFLPQMTTRPHPGGFTFQGRMSVGA